MKRRARQLLCSNRRINRRLCAVLISVPPCHRGHRRCASSRPSAASASVRCCCGNRISRNIRPNAEKEEEEESIRFIPGGSHAEPLCAVRDVRSISPSPPCLVRSAFLGRDRGISIMLEMKSISILTGDPMAHGEGREGRDSPSPHNTSCGLMPDRESS